MLKKLRILRLKASHREKENEKPKNIPIKENQRPHSVRLLFKEIFLDIIKHYLRVKMVTDIPVVRKLLCRRCFLSLNM